MVDLGISSAQLDRAERGFSFRRDGPLDMRMDRSRGESAAELLARIGEEELLAVLRDFGEERFARAIARAIVTERARQPIVTTAELAALVSRSVPHRERHKDPATRTFQALRIAVNGELDELRTFLADAPACLAPGGRLVVISFHSLEDRLAKYAFRALAVRKGEPGYRADEEVPEAMKMTARGELAREKDAGEAPGGASAGSVRLRILTKHVVVPSDEERASNPRARSAKLRAVERLS
jgi:16S rRNA (cytosine1402-N4)-methyltransferase